VAQGNRRAAGLKTAPPQAATESKNRNLVVRLATAAVLIPVVLVCIYYGGWALAALVAVAALLNATEISAMMLGRERLGIVPALAALAMPVFFLLPKLGPENLHWLWAIVTIVAMFWRLLRNVPVDSAGRDVSAVLFAAVYGSLIGYIMPLRLITPEQGWSGGGWVLLACVITWINDTGAYFAGRFLGKHKMYPRISPAKTWEGFFGGMASSIAGAFIVRVLALPSLRAVDCVALGILAGIFGPLGDLAESMLKRACKVKDSGHLLPGHGGMLDRVDSLMLNAPMLYFYYRLFLDPHAG
jgi:phosphatidate cytidylyltransferase